MTKNRCSMIAGLFLLALSLNASAFDRIPGKITKITDGDTVNVMPTGAAAGTKALKIRMLSMDTAELHLQTPRGNVSQGFWGEQGQKQLASLVSLGDQVEVEEQGKDTYGRTLGRVFKNGKDINREMVASGWAALYIICDGGTCEVEPDYRSACRAAVKSGLGLFDPAKPVPELPFLFRSINQQRPLSKFVGDVRTKTYVAPKDYDSVPVCERVFFMSEKIATDEGFSPAVN